MGTGMDTGACAAARSPVHALTATNSLPHEVEGKPWLESDYRAAFAAALANEE